MMLSPLHTRRQSFDQHYSACRYLNHKSHLSCCRSFERADPEQWQCNPFNKFTPRRRHPIKLVSSNQIDSRDQRYRRQGIDTDDT
jgi:hypothetical protein